ncbi:hypothetical protein Q9233_015698 [Columba guinea]|nr:hypothetical protein Q9233_015698 [Columba guinea]
MVGGGASRVPQRWTDYIPLGRRIPGTRFIAFKVPLKRSFDRNLHPEERFSPRDLIKKIKEQKEELGLIIDLTYTTRYYGPEVSLGLTVGEAKLCVSPDIAENNLKELPATLCYSKILTMGHEIPNKHTIFQFKCVVDKFLRDNQDNDKLIGVHCTHGLNRTGYLVCRYLIDVEGMEADTAIELFNRSRGHPIERTNYIQDLRKRSERKSSSSTKDQHRRGVKAQAQHRELVMEHRVMEPRQQPCGLVMRNCQVSLPANEWRDELCFPHLHPPPETQTARKRRRRYRRPVVTA